MCPLRDGEMLTLTSVFVAWGTTGRHTLVLLVLHGAC